MKTQNFKNHARFVPLYHFGTVTLAVLIFIASVIHIFYSSDENFILSVLFALLCLTVVLAAFYSRIFSLKAQDRAIRVEEKFRYYLLTGKEMDPRLTIQQIIGLRFASDEEFVTLAERAVKEQLSGKEIKQSIQHWRGDYYRV
ncbi:DUF6526 family protein [Flavobacteriaceae bacterium F08102]|nr:DUF6526 family protein [Flavobacteriaceae bacterium F08102]